MDMKYNHVYDATLHNHEIWECEKDVCDQNDKINHKKVSKEI